MTNTEINSSSQNSLRLRVIQKLDKLSIEQLSSVYQFIESLEYQQKPTVLENPQTNEDIDQVVELYRQLNLPRPSGLAKGEFIVPDDFNAPLPDEILDLFEGK